MSDWYVTNRLGKHAQWCSDEFPDWQIYEQTAGFFVWHEFHFHSQHPTFGEAMAAVKAAS